MKNKLKIFFVFLIATLACNRENTITEPDLSAPTAIPEGLRIYKARDGEIGIEWIKFNEPNLKGYNIYRAENISENFHRTGFTTTDYYLDDSLDYNTEYYYKITSVNGIGSESGFSATVSAKPVNVYPPLFPYQLQANARNWEGKKSILLSWLSFGPSDLSHFEIYRRTEDGVFSSTDLIGTTISSVFEDSLNLNLLQRYYYRIKAVDKGGLKSKFIQTVSDIILDKPLLISPASENISSALFQFVFISAGAPATYKIIIQSNRFVDIVDEIHLNSDAIHDTLRVPYGTAFLETNHTYYWRVAAYTNSLNNANSFSELNSFTIVNGE